MAIQKEEGHSNGVDQTEVLSISRKCVWIPLARATAFQAVRWREGVYGSERQRERRSVSNLA